jgi:hypothetical protein
MQSQQINNTQSFDQVFQLIKTWSVPNKIAFAKLLERETFKERFEALLQSLETNTLAEDDITREVEAERLRRFVENSAQ